MLVFSRKRGEKFLIGDNITVTVVDIKGTVARLAVEAPREVQVLRSELIDRNREAEEGGDAA